MCELVTTALASIGSAVSTAAGSVATAVTQMPMMGIGTALSVGGSVIQGVNDHRMGKAQSRSLAQQARDERSLAAVQDSRTRQQMRAQMAQQRAELASRGVSLDSASAILLGQTAAQEMSFESQAIRSGGAARVTQLSHEARIARGQATQGLLRGGVNAAGSFLTATPKLWPELGRT